MTQPETSRRLFLAAGSATAVFGALATATALAEDKQPFADLIQRHRKAVAEWDAAITRGDDEEGDRLGDLANDRLEEIIAAPCASDAELIAKLRYLIKYTLVLVREPPSIGNCEWSAVAAAAFRHLFPGELA